jgi:hypothetical protein
MPLKNLQNYAGGRSVTREEELAAIEAALGTARYTRVTPEMVAEYEEKRTLRRRTPFLSQIRPDGTKRRTRPEHVRRSQS